MPACTFGLGHDQDLAYRLCEPGQVPGVDEDTGRQHLGRTGVLRHDEHAFPFGLARNVLVADHVESVSYRGDETRVGNRVQGT